MRAAVVILLWAACAAAPVAGPAAQGPALKVRPRGKTLLLTERGRSHALRVADRVDAARITDASVIFKGRAGGFLYLLLDVCGPSKARPDDRQCGAGVECNLLWLKLDANRRVADSASARYESCWAPVTSGEGYRVEGRTLRATVSDFRESRLYEYTYDAERPERGLQARESPLPENP